jgi:Domain of unknown function (DUF6378)
MRHTEFITRAARLVAARRETYGEPGENFQRCADIASLILGQKVDITTVSLIMLAMKLARMPQSADDADHYIDLIGYAAFHGEFMMAEIIPDSDDAKPATAIKSKSGDTVRAPVDLDKLATAIRDTQDTTAVRGTVAPNANGAA